MADERDDTDHEQASQECPDHSKAAVADLKLPEKREFEILGDESAYEGADESKEYEHYDVHTPGAHQRARRKPADPGDQQIHYEVKQAHGGIVIQC